MKVFATKFWACHTIGLTFHENFLCEMFTSYTDLQKFSPSESEVSCYIMVVDYSK